MSEDLETLLTNALESRERVFEALANALDNFKKACRERISVPSATEGSPEERLRAFVAINRAGMQEKEARQLLQNALEDYDNAVNTASFLAWAKLDREHP